LTANDKAGNDATRGNFIRTLQKPARLARFAAETSGTVTTRVRRPVGGFQSANTGRRLENAPSGSPFSPEWPCGAVCGGSAGPRRGRTRGR